MSKVTPEVPFSVGPENPPREFPRLARWAAIIGVCLLVAGGALYWTGTAEKTWKYAAGEGDSLMGYADTSYGIGFSDVAVGEEFYLMVPRLENISTDTITFKDAALRDVPAGIDVLGLVHYQPDKLRPAKTLAMRVATDPPQENPRLAKTLPFEGQTLKRGMLLLQETAAHIKVTTLPTTAKIRDFVVTYEVGGRTVKQIMNVEFSLRPPGAPEQ